MRALAILLAIAFVVGCGGGTPDSPEAPEIGAHSSATEAAAETATRPELNTGEGDGTNWIGVGRMSSEAIEIIWSPVDGVSDYVLYRLDEPALADPGAARPDDGEEVYRGPEVEYRDTDLTKGAGYLYLIVVEKTDGSALPSRFREAVAVDDEEPPSPITGLVATRTDDGVRLSWDASTENYRFDAYDVRQLMDNGEYEWIGGAYAPNQTAFLDDRADPDAQITYEVLARDYHQNVSRSAEIIVAPGG